MPNRIIIQTKKRSGSLAINMPYRLFEHRLVCESEKDIVSLNAEIFRPLINSFNLKVESIPACVTILDASFKSDWVTNENLTVAFCELLNQKFLHPHYVLGSIESCKYVFCPLRYITNKYRIPESRQFDYSNFSTTSFVKFYSSQLDLFLNRGLVDMNSFLPNIVSNIGDSPRYIKEEFQDVTLLDIAIKSHDSVQLNNALNMGARFSAPRVSGFGLWITRNLQEIFMQIRARENSAKLYKELLDYYSDAFNNYYVEGEDNNIYLNQTILRYWFELALRSNDKESILNIIADDNRLLKLGPIVKDSIANLYPPEAIKYFDFSLYFYGHRYDFITQEFRDFINSRVVLPRLCWGATKKKWDPNASDSHVILDAFTGRPARRLL